MVRGRKLRRPSPGLVVASIALLIALGGTSFAAGVITIPNGSVGNAQLKADAVTSGKVKNGTLLNTDFKAGQLPAGPTGPAGPAGPAGAAGAAGAAGPAGPSDAYAKFLNGPIAVPNSAPITLTSLSIPQAGNYVIVGKAYLQATAGAGGALCGLMAGTDGDPAPSLVTSAGPLMVASTLVHKFDAAGNVDFKCGASIPTASASWIKITAIRVGNLTAG